MKTIQYFTKSQYGQNRQFVHPANEFDRKLIEKLTGQKTINSDIMGCIEMLSGNTIKFQEVIAPH